MGLMWCWLTCRHLRALTQLRCGNCCLTPSLCAALGALTRMRVFALDSVTDTRVLPHDWVFMRHWPDLVDLSLRDCGKFPRGSMPLLFHMHPDAQLARLSLRFACDLRAVPYKHARVIEMARALAQHTRLAALELSWCNVDAVAAKVLARRAFTALRQLSALSLLHNYVDDEAAGEIARCLRGAPLARLVMPPNPNPPDHDPSSSPDDLLTAAGVEQVLARLGDGPMPLYLKVGSAWFEARKGEQSRLRAAAPAHIVLDFDRFSS